MSATLAFVFPGQGSQQVGMLRELADRYSVVRTTFDEASDALGFDLWKVTQEGSAEALNATATTQPALLTASVAVWRVWQELEGVRPAVLAGHSLGEYSAMVCGGAMGFADGVRLVRLRGEYMQAAVAEGKGAMAAILGLEDEKVEALCAEAAQGEVVAAVNYNSPGQVVIAGDKAAVNRAVSLCSDAGAKRAVMLSVSVPSHCSLMLPAAEKLAAAMDYIALKPTRYPVIQNVDAAAHDDVETLKARLLEQLYSPVRWSDSVSRMVDQGITTLVECGPGKVLSGLAKRINRRLKGVSVNDPDTLSAALALTSETGDKE